MQPFQRVDDDFERCLRRCQEWRRAGEIPWDAQRVSQLSAPLFHYTNYAALEAIIETGKFWFTDVSFLNDRLEFEYGLDAAVSIASNHPLRTANKLIQIFVDNLSRTFPRQARRAFRFYTASFSTVRDNLEQWRAYGDFGKGCSLGFAPSVFGLGSERPSLPRNVALSASMIYDKVVVEEEMREAMNLAIGWLLPLGLSFNLLTRDRAKNFVTKFSVEVAKVLTFLAIRAKHESFKNECEVRATIGRLKGDAAELKYRPRNGQQVPYLAPPFPLDDGSLVEILIGPAAEAGLAQKVKALLAHNGLTRTRVAKSELPFRA